VDYEQRRDTEIRTKQLEAEAKQLRAKVAILQAENAEENQNALMLRNAHDLELKRAETSALREQNRPRVVLIVASATTIILLAAIVAFTL
jgi:hypothetical protein